MNNLITVKTAIYINDLSVAKSYLEDNDVKCFLKDQYLGQMHPAVTASVGIQLQVAETDVEKALELLISGGFATKEEYEGYSDPLTRFIENILNKFND